MIFCLQILKTSGFIGLTLVKVAFFILSLSGSAQKTRYIDFNATEGGDGTLALPFNDFDRISFSNTDSVFVRCGGEYNLSNSFVIANAHDLLISSYDTGNPPLLLYKGEDPVIDLVNCTNIIIQGLDIRGEKNALCGVRAGGIKTESIVVRQCNISECRWGIRFIGEWDKGALINNQIYNIADDGVFVKDVTNVEVSDCRIYNVNIGFFTSLAQGNGDGIQLLGKCNGFLIQKNIIDRSATPRKFCFIYNAEEETGVTGIFKENHCITPRYGGGGAAVYIGRGRGILIYRNYFTGGGQGIGNLSDSLVIAYNIFDSLSNGITSFTASNLAYVYNNTFANIPRSIIATALYGRNNLFLFSKLLDKGVIMNGPSLKNWEQNRELSLFLIRKEVVNYDDGDYQPVKGSDLIDAGILTPFHIDFYGTHVPFGAAPDIGAIETHFPD